MPKKPAQRTPTARENLAEQSNLTHAQLAVWLAQTQASAPGRFNRVLIFELDGRVDGNAFQRAFRALVESHDALRLTVAADTDGVPQWHLLPVVDGGLSLLDFSADADPEQTLQTWLRDRCGSGFESGQPLFHSALIRLGEQRHVWYLNQHQLITDGISTALVCKRMADLYAKTCSGNLEPLPSYPRFKEYVSFERRHREAPVYNHTRNYWETKLAQHAAAPVFFGRSRAEQPSAGPRERVIIELGPESSAGLRELCRVPGHFLNSLGFSQFMAFVTLLFAFVQRATGQDLVRMGAPFHSRGHGLFDETVGLLSETCPVQLQVEPKVTLQNLLRAVLKEVRSVLMHAQPGASCAVAEHPCALHIDYLSLGCNRFRGINSRVLQVNTECGNPGTLLHLQVLDFSACDSITLQFTLDPEVFGERERALLTAQFPALVDAFLHQRDTPLADIELPLAAAAAMPAAAATATIGADAASNELTEEPLMDA